MLSRNKKILLQLMLMICFDDVDRGAADLSNIVRAHQSMIK